ncbi:MAG: hypothetical protein ABI690_21020 [Chloroflexota bacterium]|jgi:hypothetical protein
MNLNLRDNRTLMLIAVIAVAAVMILNPNWLLYALGVIQSVVIIVLGIVAIQYLRKRM